MKSLNKAMVIGHVGMEPEIRSTKSGKRVASIRLATAERWGSGDSRKEETTWHNIVAWEGLANVVADHVKKGDRLYIEGRIQVRSWEDKDGNKRYATEIVARDLIMLGGLGEKRTPKPAATSAPAQSDGQYGADYDDDLPF